MRPSSQRKAADVKALLAREMARGELEGLLIQCLEELPHLTPDQKEHSRPVEVSSITLDAVRCFLGRALRLAQQGKRNREDAARELGQTIWQLRRRLMGLKKGE